MPGEGFMLHMIQTLRNNTDLRRSKKRRFQNRGEIITHYRERPTKKFTQEQILKSIEQIQKRFRKRSLPAVKAGIWQNWLYSIVFSLFALLVIYWLFFVF